MATQHEAPRIEDGSVFDVLAEGVVWQSADGRLVAANAAAAPILGLTHDELLGRTSRDPRWYAVHEDGTPWPGDEHPAMVALRTGEPQRGTIMGIMAPGKGRRWIAIHAMPLKIAGSDQPTGVVASFVDVTEQIDLRHRHEEQAKELADLYNQAPCGYHTLDAEGRFTRINDTELAWLGLPRERVIGRLGPMDFLTDACKETFRSRFSQIVAGQPLRGVECEMVGAQGRHRHLLLSAEPIKDAQGRFAGTRSVVHDITELHNSRSAMQRLNADQAALLDNELVGIARLQQRRITWTNRAFGRIFGYEAAELLGLSTAALYPDAEAFEAFGASAYGVLNAGGTYHSQQELRRKDGGRVWVDCFGMTANQNPDEAIWFVIDITAHRRSEELRLQTLRLEAENRQLLQTSELHSNFLANMSHELRTPLNAVIGYAGLLRRGAIAADSDKFNQYLDQIESSGRHLLAMIESMLDSAKAESGQLFFHPERIRAGTVLGQVTAMLEASAQQKQVVLTVEVAPDVPTLVLDPLRLRQVLLNYIGNAIKFSHRGGRVDVRVTRADAAQVRIEVEDQGIGISPADQTLLFTRFHQVSSGPRKAYEGTGIGLSLVKLIVEAQGGAVGVRSALGQGSVFWATLPVAYPATQ